MAGAIGAYTLPARGTAVELLDALAALEPGDSIPVYHGPQLVGQVTLQGEDAHRRFVEELLYRPAEGAAEGGLSPGRLLLPLVALLALAALLYALARGRIRL